MSWEIGLTYDLVNNIFVAGKDPKRHRVLLGGLGCLGVGQMWSGEECLRGNRKRQRQYKKAPIMNSWMGFGTKEAWDELMKCSNGRGT